MYAWLIPDVFCALPEAVQAQETYRRDRCAVVKSK